MTFDSLAKYSDESIGICKDFVAFLKNKAKLDAEYAKNLAKLCQTTMTTFQGGLAGVGGSNLQLEISSVSSADGTVSGGTLRGKAALSMKNAVKEDRTAVLKMTIWKCFLDSIEAFQNNAAAARSVSNGIMVDIVNPIQIYIKDSEVSRKNIIDENVRQTNVLQDAYNTLKKAKEGHDSALKANNETKEALVKAQRSPNVKEKDLDKLKSRLLQTQEKFTAADLYLKQVDDCCKQSQSDFYKITLPNLMDMLYRKEEERCTAMHNALRNWSYLEKQYSDVWAGTMLIVDEKVETVDLATDLEELFAEHMIQKGNDPDDSEKDVSVRSIIDPVKAGRMLKKSDSSDNWKPRYFILIGDKNDPKNPDYQAVSGKLYYFESESALKPKGVIELALCSVYSVDASTYPNQSNLLAITMKNSESSYEQCRTIYVAAASKAEKESWIMNLRKYCACCSVDVASALMDRTFLNYSPPSDSQLLPKPTNEELNLRVLSSLRLWIMEAKGLPVLDPSAVATSSNTLNEGFSAVGENIMASLRSRNQPYIYITVSTNGCVVASTTTKSGTSPFFGEDFHLDNLADCTSSLRFSVKLSARRQDAEIGCIDLPLETIKQSSLSPSISKNSIHQKFDAWLPIQASQNINGNPSSSHADRGNDNWGAIRISAIYSEELILPLPEYSGLFKCITESNFQVLREFARCTEKCTAFARDDFNRSLAKILIQTGKDFSAIKYLAAAEIETVEDPNIIFRGNTLITKLIDQYLKVCGGEFLKDTLSGPIKLVFEKTSKNESCEVDPARLEKADEETIKKNQRRLMNWAQLFWDAVLNSVSRCPPKIRGVLNDIREVVAEIFARKIKRDSTVAVQFSSVSGFIFLRFFCPAILSPKMFGLWPEMTENAVASRTLTLIAKCIQNLANLSDFSGKEPYMEFLNPWINSNLDQMKFCILQFSSRNSFTGTSVVDFKETANEDISREFNHLFLYIRSNLEGLRQYYQEMLKNQTKPREDADKQRNENTSALDRVFKTINMTSNMIQLYHEALLEKRAPLIKIIDKQRLFCTPQKTKLLPVEPVVLSAPNFADAPTQIESLNTDPMNLGELSRMMTGVLNEKLPVDKIVVPRAPNSDSPASSRPNTAKSQNQSLHSLASIESKHREKSENLGRKIIKKLEADQKSAEI